MERKRGDGDDKKKKKKATILKMARRACSSGSSSSNDDDLGADPFSNPNIIQNLIDKFVLSEEEVEALKVQENLQAKIDCLQGKVDEAECLTEEKATKNENLRGVLRKEELISIRLKAAFALEEEKKKEVEIKVIELEVKMSKSISEVAARAMEEFKASFKMKDLNIAFSQKAFIKGFELYEGNVAQKFSELDLSFLEEELDKEMGPSNATADPSPAKVVFESSEPTAEVLEPM
ncbi:hypothetical protein COCNU_scaffold003121G000010 [Cocos nucifera]|nr:hypothetical protein [Cocos nucifera]